MIDYATELSPSPY